MKTFFETTRSRNYGPPGGFTWQTTLVDSADVIGTGKTKDEAEAAALTLVKAQVGNAHKVRYFTSPSGKTLFIVRFQWGWSYDIVREGKSLGSCSCGDTFEQCCKYAGSHAASYSEEMG